MSVSIDSDLIASRIGQRLERDFAKGQLPQSNKPSSRAKKSPNGTASQPRKRQREKERNHLQQEDSGQIFHQNGRGKHSNLPNGNDSRTSGTKDDALKAEILALGGHESDLDIVGGLQSDDDDEEIGGTNQNDHQFGKELENFAKTLGFSNGKPSTRPPVEPIRDLKPKKADEPRKSAKAEIVRDSKTAAPRLKILVDETASTKPPPAKDRRAKLLVPLSAEWYTVETPSVPKSTQKNPPNPSDVQELAEFASQLLETENATYAADRTIATASKQFMETIITSGTLTDKIGAVTLSVQESPLHNMKSLTTLLQLAQKRSRGQAVEVLGALKDLFGQGGLLPSDRKLYTFVSQPALRSIDATALSKWKPGQALPNGITESQLVLWAFEEWLKSKYFEVLSILERWCNDEVVFARTKALDFVYSLLREKPEQEANLLRLLVNKLGDTDRKVASKASYNLLQLQASHPMMKTAIVRSIESELIFRPGQNIQARYYAVITLNQTQLSSSDGPLVEKLFDVYFTLFVMLLKGKTETQDAAIATKITYNKKGERQGGGSAPGKLAIKRAAALEHSKAQSEDLREKLMSALLTGVNRALPYAESQSKALQGHLDTLFKITHSSNFNTSIQALSLIQQMAETDGMMADRFYRTLYESLLDRRLLSTSKQAMYLNVLYRALKADSNRRRTMAFVKRLCQISALHQPAFACAIIYLVSELEATLPTIRSSLNKAEDNESDGEQHFEDVQEHSDGEALETETAASHIPSYDGRKRDPQFSHAENSALWEVIPLTSSYHPSTALFTQRLLGSDQMPPKPDLSSNTLIHFLDRFVYRNPKKNAGLPRGPSIMQPLANAGESKLLVSSATRIPKAPVNAPAFRNLDVGQVKPEDVFFHSYFRVQQPKKDKSSKKRKDGAHESLAEVSDEDGDVNDEDEIWQALVKSKPEVEGSADEDDFESDDGDLLDELGSDSDDMLDLDEDSEDEIEGGEELGAESLSDMDDNMEVDQSDDEQESSRETGAEVQADESKSGERRKKRKLKHLPVFASTEDYAQLLDQEDSS